MIQTQPNIAVVISTQNCHDKAMLSACIDTLLQQTYATLVIYVLVDIANVDLNEVVYEYMDKDARVHLVTRNNSTQVEDFYFSYKWCAEPYIAFVEATQWFDEQYIASLYNQLIETNSQMAVNAFTLYDEPTGVYRFYNLEFVSDTRNTQFIMENAPVFMWYEQFRQLSLTGKLYKREVLQKSIALGEMTLLPLVALQQYFVCDKVTFSEGTKYVRRHTNDMDIVVDVNNIPDYLMEFNKLFKLLSYKQYQTRHYFTYYKNVLHEMLKSCHIANDRRLEEMVTKELHAISALLMLS